VAQKPDARTFHNKTRKVIQRKILQDSSSEKGSSDLEQDEVDSNEEELKVQETYQLLSQAPKESQSSLSLNDTNNQSFEEHSIQQLREIVLPKLGEEIMIL
jgi:hypothetical protein